MIKGNAAVTDVEILHLVLKSPSGLIRNRDRSIRV
jgi:hypothetical protein